MAIWAKFDKTTGDPTETLETHTSNVVKEIFSQLDDCTLKYFSDKTDLPKKRLKELAFFCGYFHDIGKTAKSFQNKQPKSYHALLSVNLLQDVKEFEEQGINFVLLTVLSHHTPIYRGIYRSSIFDNVPAPEICSKPEFDHFVRGYADSYSENIGETAPAIVLTILADCSPQELVKEFIDDTSVKLRFMNSEDKLRARNLFIFLSGLLNFADWRASGNLTVTEVETDTLDILGKLKERAKEKGIRFQGLHPFQTEAEKTNGNIIIKIPTGEGKTEAALLWAISNLTNEKTKIIYTMPTQTTSNAMFERFKRYFGKENVGILHGSSFTLMEEEYADREERLSESSFQRTFSKPVMVSTLDSFLYTFMNLHRWS